MGKINQPSTQIKLTNVSLVRMKKGKKRFEIACYQNKVQDWRSGVEKDISEVLQIEQVFTNVSKGQVAPHDELSKSFGTNDLEKIVLEILNKGEIQLSEKERGLKNEQLTNEILQIISSKCINPKSKKRYPPTMILKALNELKFNITGSGVGNSGTNNNQGGKIAKVRALEAIKVLVKEQIIPIARAKMKVKITMDNKDAKKVLNDNDGIFKKNLLGKVEDEEWDEKWECITIIEPENYKEIMEYIDGSKIKINKKGSIEVLNMAVIDESGNDL
ncbi:hypothetical protein B5S33_g3980 [[Candida] boidinii]|nr:hypothetical protein B5S33_g3980 [[Candida] boidinii]